MIINWQIYNFQLNQQLISYHRKLATHHHSDDDGELTRIHRRGKTQQLCMQTQCCQQGCESSFLNGTQFSSSSKTSVELLQVHFPLMKFLSDWNSVRFKFQKMDGTAGTKFIELRSFTSLVACQVSNSMRGWVWVCITEHFKLMMPLP